MNGDVARLGRYVRARRHELDRTQLDVAAAGGPSNSTLTSLEKGEDRPVSRTTLNRLDVGLDWMPGSAKAVLEGGEPKVQTAIPVRREPTWVAAPGVANDGPAVTNAAVLEAIRDMADAVREMSRGAREREQRLEERLDRIERRVERG